MDKILDSIDRSIDVNMVIMERCLDSMISVANKHIQPEMYGNDKSPMDSAGFFQAVCGVFSATRDDCDIDDLDASELQSVIDQYVAEKESKKQAALEAGGEARETTVPVMETTIPAKPGVVSE